MLTEGATEGATADNSTTITYVTISPTTSSSSPLEFTYNDWINAGRPPNFQTNGFINIFFSPAIAGAGTSNHLIPNNVIIGKDVITIEQYAFYNCSNITSVKFESGSKLQTIGKNAFSNCSITEITSLPTTLKIIGEAAFYLCRYLTNIVFSSDFLIIGPNAFLDTDLKTVSANDTTLNSLNLIAGGSQFFYGADNVNIINSSVSIPTMNIQTNDAFESYFTYLQEPMLSIQSSYLGSSVISNSPSISGAVVFRNHNTSTTLYKVTINNPNNFDIVVMCTGAGGGGGGATKGNVKGGTPWYFTSGGGAGAGGGTSIQTLPNLSGDYYILIGQGGDKGTSSHPSGRNGGNTYFYDTDKTTSLVTGYGGEYGQGGGSGFYYDSQAYSLGGMVGGRPANGISFPGTGTDGVGSPMTASGGSGGNGSAVYEDGLSEAWTNDGQGYDGTMSNNQPKSTSANPPITNNHNPTPFTVNIGLLGGFTAWLGGGGGGGSLTSTSPGYGARIKNYTNPYNNIESADYWMGGDGGSESGNGGSAGNYSENHNSNADKTGNYHLMTNIQPPSTGQEVIVTVDSEELNVFVDQTTISSNIPSYGLLAGAGGGGGDGSSDQFFDGGDGADGMCIVMFQPPSQTLSGESITYNPLNPTAWSTGWEPQ